MDFFRADSTHAGLVAGVATLLWTDHEPGECLIHYTETLLTEDSSVFLCVDDGKAIGFAEFSLRHDYVEGTYARPVGYLEGIYVLDEYRRIGVARTLVHLGEQWSKNKGCRQIASDCELGNSDSLSFHLGSGFTEANRIICFVKDIDTDQ